MQRHGMGGLKSHSTHLYATGAVVGPMFIDPNLQTEGAPPGEPTQTQFALVQFYEAIYYLAAVSLAMMSIWVIWMPLVPFLLDSVATDEVTTTISDTFSRYNTITTIYMVGPLSILFLFRIIRTFAAPAVLVSATRKRYISLLLVAVQYFLLVIIRYDSIRGFMHPLSVAIVFACLLLYHSLVYNYNTNGGLKRVVRMICTLLILLFGALVWFVYQLGKSHWLYIVACIIEVLAVLTLGSLDFIDLAEYRGNYGEQLKQLSGTQSQTLDELVPILQTDITHSAGYDQSVVKGISVDNR